MQQSSDADNTEKQDKKPQDLKTQHMTAQHAGNSQRKRDKAVFLFRLFLIFCKDPVKTIRHQGQKCHRRVLSDAIHPVNINHAHQIKRIQEAAENTDPVTAGHLFKTVPGDQTGRGIDGKLIALISRLYRQSHQAQKRGQI